MRAPRLLALAIAWVAAGAATAAPAVQRKVFVGCPILRNTELPCWLGQDGGELYYLGPQGDLQAEFYPPQFRHRMLVEAEVAAGPRVCGGLPLKHVHASVLPEIDETCNVMLPAEGYPAPPAHRGPGPSGVKGGASEERTRPPPPPAPKPPFAAREFVLQFDADSARKWRQATAEVTNAARYAQAVRATRIEVIGYRAAIRLSNGRDFVEAERIAEDRAREVEESLRVLGVPETAQLSVTWRSKPIASTGTAQDAASRKVVVRVVP